METILTNGVIELVRETNKLNDLEKIKDLVLSTELGDRRLNNLIVVYYSDFMYQDKELLLNIELHRGGKNEKGSLNLDIDEISYYMKAFKSPQYYRFFMHIMNAYGNRDIYPVEDDHVFDCCMCWKRTFGSVMHDRWFTGDDIDTNKEYLAFTVDGTKTTICLDCLVQLKNFINIINTFKSL